MRRMGTMLECLHMSSDGWLVIRDTHHDLTAVERFLSCRCCVKYIQPAHLVVESQLSAEVVVDVFHLCRVLSCYDEALIPCSLQGTQVYE